MSKPRVHMVFHTDAKLGGQTGQGSASPGKNSLLNNSDVFKYQEETKKLIVDLRQELKRSYEENDYLMEQLRTKSPY